DAVHRRHDRRRNRRAVGPGEPRRPGRRARYRGRRPRGAHRACERARARDGEARVLRPGGHRRARGLRARVRSDGRERAHRRRARGHSRVPREAEAGLAEIDAAATSGPRTHGQSGSTDRASGSAPGLEEIPETGPVAPARIRLISFAPFRHSEYARLWPGAFVSNIGTWMRTIALGIYVQDHTQQAAWTGPVAAAAFV